MTIAIVASFVKPPAPAMPAEGASNFTATIDALNGNLDFASILLGLPVAETAAAAATPLPDKEASTGSESLSPETGQTAADPQILATLGFTPSLQPANPDPATSQEIDQPRQTRGTATVTVTPTPAEIKADASPPAIDRPSGKEPPAPTTLAAAEQAARFAVAAPVTPLPERPLTNQSEPAPPAGSLNTPTVAPGNVVSGMALPHEIPRDLPMPLRDPSWAGEFGQKLLWFASNDRQLAQLTLNPPQLGSIEVTLNMDRERASAHFVSLHADVRSAIETAVPRLREMFASAGIELGQVSVGSESFRQQSDAQPEPPQQPRAPVDRAILGRDSAGNPPARLITAQRGRGLIDTFA